MTSTDGQPVPPFGAYEAEATFAVRALTVVLPVLSRIEREAPRELWSKQDRSPVTVADLAVQAIVVGLLESDFPSDGLVAEEESSRLRESQAWLDAVHGYAMEVFAEASPADVLRWIDRGTEETGRRYWLLDPVDGTRGFLRGGQYVITLALVEEGEVVLGAIGCPRLDASLRSDRKGPGVVAVAVRGEGAWLAGVGDASWKRLAASCLADPSRARILRSAEPAHTDPGRLAEIQRRLRVREPSVRMDSQAKYVLLAAGEADLIFRLLSPSRPAYREKAWDIAAGAILVREAGGRVTDLRGAELDFRAGRTMQHNIGVLASNGFLHEDALRAARAVGADRRPVED